MTEWILGIDDAGRGPVIGPMILAGCLIEKKLEKDFRKLGVKDSKLLTQRRREVLAKEIKEKAENFETIITSPEEIDKKKKGGLKLNELEAQHFAEIINKINKGDKKIRVIVDCPSPNIQKWSDYLKTHIKDLSNLEVSCEHKADRNHIAVGAASILAKSTRESEMKKLKEKYGTQIGSGYTSDPATIRFLEKYVLKYNKDGIFRKSWITWQRAFEKLKQNTL